MSKASGERPGIAPRSSPLVATRFFLTSGVGVHQHDLMSFELALDSAGIENCNLVKISSVIPPGCRLISREEGLKLLVPGQVTFAVLARAGTSEPGRRIAAAVGVVMPEDPTLPGYASEVEEAYGMTESAAADQAERVVLEILASRRKVKFDPETEWDRRKKRHRVGGEDVRTRNITQAAIGDERKRHTTVVAAAILLF